MRKLSKGEVPTAAEWNAIVERLDRIETRIAKTATARGAASPKRSGRRTKAK